MEELITAIFEAIFEFILQIIIEGGAAILSHLFDDLDQKPNAKKKIKYTIGFIFFGLSILVLVMSLIYKQTLLAYVVIVYLLILVLYHMFKFINSNFWNSNIISIILSWIKRITKYSFLIALIYVGNKNLENEAAKAWLNTLSIIFIFIYVSIDIYKFNNYKQNKKLKEFEESNKKKYNDFYDDMEDRY